MPASGKTINAHPEQNREVVANPAPSSSSQAQISLSPQQMMYHHNHLQQKQQHQGKNIHSSTKMPLIPERHFIVQGVNGPGDSGLVLSTDAKPRLKWTHELHERFIEAVCQLGGAEKATPKTVMKVMGIPGLTLYHLKSHLQKYRLSKNVHGQPNSETNKIGAVAVAESRLTEANRSHTDNFSAASQTNNCGGVGNSRSLEISEALQMQIEVQRRLHEQLEVQRHLQLRIEAQGKYLQSVLEKAQETLGRQNIGAVGLETAKVQLSELVSKVSMQRLAGEFPELQRLCPQSVQPPDGSFESCLTCCEGSLKDPELHNGSLGNVGGVRLDTKDNAEGWSEVLKEPVFFSSMGKVGERSNRRSGGDLSMNIGRYLEEKEGSNDVMREGGSQWKGGRVRRSEERLWKREESVKEKQGEKEKGWSMALDLNAGEDENGSCSESKQLDLNGFSWE